MQATLKLIYRVLYKTLLAVQLMRYRHLSLNNHVKKKRTELHRGGGLYPPQSGGTVYDEYITLCHTGQAKMLHEYLMSPSTVIDNQPFTNKLLGLNSADLNSLLQTIYTECTE